MCFLKKNREKQKTENQKKMSEPYSPEKQKDESAKLFEFCQTHINSILRGYEIYTNKNTNFENQLRPETVDDFYKIQEYYTSGTALNNIELLKNEIENVSCFGEFLRIFNKAVELGGASVNHLAYVIQSHKPQRK